MSQSSNSEQGPAIGGSGPMFVEIPRSLLQHRDSASVRLGYLYPYLSFTPAADGIRVEGDAAPDVAEVRRQVLHAVYREKVQHEGQSIRTMLFEAVFK